MAKASNILIESDGDAVHSGVEVPDLASLGWPPEDHVFIPVKSQLGVGELSPPGAEVVDDISIIEFPVADLPVDGLLADLGNQDLGFFDLNDLLMQADATYEGHMLRVSDESDMNPDVAQTNHAAETSQSDMQHLPVNMAFPHLTIVIDDESDPNTVAI